MQPTSCEGRRGFAPILEVFQGGDVFFNALVSCKRVGGMIVWTLVSLVG